MEPDHSTAGPRHRRGPQRRRIWDRSQHGRSPESKLALYGVLALVVGGSMLAVNLDTVYLDRQTNGLASLPERMEAGSTTQLHVMATTPSGEPGAGDFIGGFRSNAGGGGPAG